MNIKKNSYYASDYMRSLGHPISTSIDGRNYCNSLFLNDLFFLKMGEPEIVSLESFSSSTGPKDIFVLVLDLDRRGYIKGL